MPTLVAAGYARGLIVCWQGMTSQEKKAVFVAVEANVTSQVRQVAEAWGTGFLEQLCNELDEKKLRSMNCSHLSARDRLHI